MKTVCEILGIARSNIHERLARPQNWQDGRRHRRPADDDQLLQDIRQEVASLPSYGYRRAGALVNRLEHTVANLMNVNQRLQEAVSGIVDADYAAESANLARGMVLQQAGTAMLAQANQAPQYVLLLLRA